MSTSQVQPIPGPALLMTLSFGKKSPYILSRLRPEEWYKLVGVLWNNIPAFNDLFTKIIQQLESIRFEKTGYCDIEAVLVKYGTLLNVNRLKQLVESKTGFEDNSVDAEPIKNEKGEPIGSRFVPKVSVKCDNGIVSEIEKRYLCAIIQEVVFTVEHDLKDEKAF